MEELQSSIVDLKILIVFLVVFFGGCLVYLYYDFEKKIKSLRERNFESMANLRESLAEMVSSSLSRLEKDLDRQAVSIQNLQLERGHLVKEFKDLKAQIEKLSGGIKGSRNEVSELGCRVQKELNEIRGSAKKSNELYLADFEKLQEAHKGINTEISDLKLSFSSLLDFLKENKLLEDKTRRKKSATKTTKKVSIQRNKQRTK